MYTHSINFSHPLVIGKRYFGDLTVIAHLKYTSKSEYKDYDIVDLELGNKLSMIAFAEFNYLSTRSVEEILKPIIESYQDEGAEAVQTFLDARERYNEEILETEKSLQNY